MISPFPELCLIPRDPVDRRFALSFDVGSSTDERELAVEFFAEYGFVVVSNVFSDQECRDTRESMWSIIEKAHPGFLR